MTMPKQMLQVSIEIWIKLFTMFLPTFPTIFTMPLPTLRRISRRMRRVSLAEGWDVGTSAQAMSDDLLLGLRDGFCGALSTFSSWSSSMVNLLRNGQVSDAVVGYVIGIQLPIVSYRFGQHMAVYLFIWRSRRETRKDERRGGYGIRLPQQADDEDENDNEDENDEHDATRPIPPLFVISRKKVKCHPFVPLPLPFSCCW